MDDPELLFETTKELQIGKQRKNLQLQLINAVICARGSSQSVFLIAAVVDSLPIVGGLLALAGARRLAR